MARAFSPLWLMLVLGIGIGLGMMLGRAGPVVSAQATAPTPVAEAAVTPAPSTAAQAKAAGSEEALYAELSRQYAQFEGVNRTFELVARVVAPSVVHIVAKKSGERDSRRGHPQFFEETGSGVIVRPEGGREEYVLTNNHVVESSKPGDIDITLHDGRVIRPERFWTDRKADIAVLRLNRDDLPAARLGNSDRLTAGSWVLALGSPFGLTHSVSHGIISARNRHEDELEDDGVENQEFLQTDAAINPGNSGGPLVNLKGEVVGINTAIASNGGGSEGVGFSIPINLARWIMGQLIVRGKVSRGALGVNLQDLDADMASRRGLDRPRGACILFVGSDTPASQAGFRDGDVILRFNGIEVLDINHLINLVSYSTIGQQVEVVLWRERKSLMTKVAIADQEALRPGDTQDHPQPGKPPRRAPRSSPQPAEDSRP